MNSKTSESEVACETESPARWPAVAVGLGSLLMAVLLCPSVLRRFLTTEWQIGDVSFVAAALSLGFALLAVGCAGFPMAVNRWFDQMLPRGRRLMFAVAAMTMSLVLVLTATEVALRVTRFPFSGSWVPSENALAQFDDRLGWSYIPNQTVSQTFGDDSRKIKMHFDENGIRVADRTIPLDRTRPSALFVGGSFTMGHGLSFEETFSGRLASRAGFDLQVVNLGVQGFGTDQALLQLERHIERFNTKLVVYTFMSDHHRRNANYDRRLIFPSGSFLGTKPWYRLSRDGKPVLTLRPRRYEDMAFVHLWGVAQGAWTHWGPVPSTDLTRSLIMEMHRLATDHGAEFVVVDWKQGELQPCDTGTVSELSSLPVQQINTAADAPDGWDSWIIPGEFHPDAQSNGRVAELLYEKLRAMGVVADE